MMIALVMVMILVLSACATPGETGGSNGTAPAERRSVDRSNPAEYFNATWAYTMRHLESELMSLGDNRVFAQMGEIFATGEFDIELLLNVNSFMGFDAGMPLITSNLSNSLRDRVLALTVDVQEMMDIGLFLTDSDVIVSFLGENISVSASNFFDDLMAFSNANGLGLERELDIAMLEEMGISGLSYSELFIGPSGGLAANDSLSEYTLNRLEELYDELARGFVYTIEDRTVDFDQIQGDVIVTSIAVNGSRLNEFIVDALKVILDDEIYQSMGFNAMLMDEMHASIDELSGLMSGYIAVQFIERDGRYIAIRIEDPDGSVFEIGAIGEVNMLDNFYISFDDPDGFDSFFFSITGSNVNTDNYSVNVTIRTDFDTIMFSFEWDTTQSYDNFVIDLHALGNIRGTFAVSDNNDVVFSLSSARIGGETITFSDGDFKITISDLGQAINVPTNLRPLRDMSMFDIEMLIMPLVFAFM